MGPRRALTERPLSDVPRRTQPELPIPDDTIVLSAFTRYGFTCGPEGMEFLTIRMGEASVQVGE